MIIMKIVEGESGFDIYKEVSENYENNVEGYYNEIKSNEDILCFNNINELEEKYFEIMKNEDIINFWGLEKINEMFNKFKIEDNKFKFGDYNNFEYYYDNFEGNNVFVLVII